MSSAGTAQLFFAAADGLTADALKDADDNLPTPTPSECSDYWDPPCRVCKKVDNEANVLCDICNGAYHLDCIANIKPPLPRQPTDDEWFCRSCIKRGIPESIIDRVGRGSSAHYLVKWVGRQLWEVSWETAKELDTPWSRKLIKGYMETERRAEGEPSILPPSHALIDRQARVKELALTLSLTPNPDPNTSPDQARVKELDALERAVVPAELDRPALEQLLAEVHALCARCGAEGEHEQHLLAPLVREAGKG